MDNLKRTIVPILESYGVKLAALFGSFSRGDQTEKSDIDILILPPDHMGLKFVTLKLDLEKALERDVDLVSYNAIHPALKDDILASQVRII